jgi:uncharacterized protein (DUF305 family)
MVRLLWLSPLLLVTLASCSPSKREAPANMAMPMAGDSAATRDYKSSMTTMMDKMPTFTGDADADFMMQMRGHHQSAIAMATVELANGKDPEARALAKTIIDAQKAEIAQIGTWLGKKGS